MKLKYIDSVFSFIIIINACVLFEYYQQHTLREMLLVYFDWQHLWGGMA